MEQSVLDRIKQGNHVASDFIWRNGKMGVITDMKYSGKYRFFECYIGENGMLHRRHPGHEPIENNPLVCIGITADWLENRKGPAGIKRIFDVYTKRAFEDFKYKLRNDVKTVYWKDDDWEKYFYMFSIPQEEHKNEVSEALFEYVTESDVEQLRGVMKSYIEYLEMCRDKILTLQEDEIVRRLVPYFISEEYAKKYYEQIKGMRDTEITSITNKYWQAKWISEDATSTAIWRVLHDNGIYSSSDRNWCRQVKFEKREER